MTPESWHNHATTALRRERYVVRNSRGELLPTGGIVETQPDETLEFGPRDRVIADVVGEQADLAYRAGWLLGHAAGSRERSPFLPLLALIAGAVIGFAAANILSIAF